MAEIFDIFDADFKPLAPFTMTRAEVHKKGIWHQVFHCWIVRRDAAGDKIVLQLRSAEKESNPNTFDISAAGHLQSGETVLDGLREIDEELGLRVTAENIHAMGILSQEMDENGYIDREFCHTFFHETTHPIAHYKPQLAEVDGVYEVSIADMILLIEGTVEKIPAQGLKRVGDNYVADTLDLTRARLCRLEKRLNDGYYPRIFHQAKEFLTG